MKTVKWYLYTFTDGYFTAIRGRLTKAEIAWEERTHGKLKDIKVMN